MLLSLSVKNLALIEEAEVYFERGLNILTGETGAGKSIIIGSINLALGAKVSGSGADVIRAGADYALIELVFAVDKDEQAAQIKEMGLPLGDDAILALSRRIMPGRSVFRINGETVALPQLKQLAGLLLDIHGQHERHMLLKAANHREILDSFGGDELAPLKDELRGLCAEYKAVSRELEKEALEESARRREIELLEFEIAEIEAAALVAGEDIQCEKDWQKMSNAAKLRAALKAAHDLTGYEGAGSAGSQIGRAVKEIRAVAAMDDDIEGLAGQLAEIDSLLNDFNRTAADYLFGLDFDDRQLQQTEQRLNQLNGLKSKYRATIEGILAQKQERQARVELLRDYENYRAGLSQKRDSLRGQILAFCRELSASRRALGGALAGNMRLALEDLNFHQVGFEVVVTSDEEAFDGDGHDGVLFMIAPNPGEEPRSLDQIASGGELSRIMLALKTIKAGQDDKGTLIFDEIDAGISGKTAWKVAERLAVLAHGHQVICITHLAQIAAMADAHFVIEKTVTDGRTVTKIGRLADDEGIGELARLLGGESVTEAVMTNAAELSRLAGAFKAGAVTP